MNRELVLAEARAPAVAPGPSPASGGGERTLRLFGVEPGDNYAAELRAHYAAGRRRMFGGMAPAQVVPARSPLVAPAPAKAPALPKPCAAKPPALAPYAPPPPLPSRGALRRILAAVAADYDTEVAALMRESRLAHFVEPRHVFFHLACALTSCSRSEIGRQTKRDSTTVLFGCRKVEKRLRSDPAFAERVARIAAACDIPALGRSPSPPAPLAKAELSWSPRAGEGGC